MTHTRGSQWICGKVALQSVGEHKEHPRDITKDEEFQEEREALQSVSSPGQMESTWWGHSVLCNIL